MNDHAVRTAVFLGLSLLSVAGCSTGRPTAPTEDDPKPATDLDRLQGVWAVESFDAGDPKGKLPPGLKVEDMRTQFVGNEMGMGVAGRITGRMSFSLQENANPKVMTVTHLGEDGQPRRSDGPKGLVPGGKPAAPRDCIYKFEGDFLVVAEPIYAVFYDKPMKRPADFTAISSSSKPGEPPVNGVTIVRLRKTDEKPVPVGKTKN